MKKRVFYTESAYALGLILLSFGTALMTHTDFGVSMVVAPSYLLHLKISQFLPFFSFGMASYVLQAVLLIVMMMVLKRFRVSYLFSFVTAVIRGLLLDASLFALSFITVESLFGRIALYVLGILICAVGLAFLFKTYIAPEVYDLFVKELSVKTGIKLHKFKTIYDCSCCVISIMLSFLFFGMWQFKGISIGSVVCSLVNGTLIGIITKLAEKKWEFRDALNFRSFFEGEKNDNKESNA